MFKVYSRNVAILCFRYAVVFALAGWLANAPPYGPVYLPSLARHPEYLVFLEIKTIISILL